MCRVEQWGSGAVLVKPAALHWLNRYMVLAWCAAPAAPASPGLYSHLNLVATLQVPLGGSSTVRLGGLAHASPSGIQVGMMP